MTTTLVEPQCCLSPCQRDRIYIYDHHGHFTVSL